MSMEKSLCEAVKTELARKVVFVGVAVVASYDEFELGSIQAVIDVSGAIAHAPGTDLPYFKLPVEVVILSDRHDDPDKTRLRELYQAVFDFMTAPRLPPDFAPEGMIVRACIPDPSQDGPDSDENYNVLNYKATFYVERVKE